MPLSIRLLCIAHCETCEAECVNKCVLTGLVDDVKHQLEKTFPIIWECIHNSQCELCIVSAHSLSLSAYVCVCVSVLLSASCSTFGSVYFSRAFRWIPRLYRFVPFHSVAVPKKGDTNTISFVRVSCHIENCNDVTVHSTLRFTMKRATLQAKFCVALCPKCSQWIERN